MTQDEIIEMAQECKLIGMRPHLDGIYFESLVALANLVAAKEREACATIADSGFGVIGSTIALAIRARGVVAPQRTWVGIDWSKIPDEQFDNYHFGDGAKWAEQHLKEKNT